MTQNRRNLYISLCLYIVTSIAGCASAPPNPYAEQAEELHRSALASADVPDHDLQEYIQQVGQRIIEAARQAAPDKADKSMFADVQFHLVDTKTLNVFETGGRHIYVYNGLFEFCQTEEELAAAMTHAYAHLLNLDIQHLGLEPDAHRPSALTAWQFVNHRFTAEQQIAADRLALKIYARAGWDPSQFQNLWQRLGDRFPGPTAPDRQTSESRAAAARAQGQTASLANRRPPVADRKTFAALRKEGMSLHAPTTLENPADVYLAAFPNVLLPRDDAAQQAAQERLRPVAPAVKLEPN